MGILKQQDCDALATRDVFQTRRACCLRLLTRVWSFFFYISPESVNDRPSFNYTAETGRIQTGNMFLFVIPESVTHYWQATYL